MNTQRLNHLVREDESDLNEYMLDPTDPVVCVPDEDDPDRVLVTDEKFAMRASLVDQDRP